MISGLVFLYENIVCEEHLNTKMRKGSTILKPDKAMTRTELVGKLYQSDISTDKCLVLPSYQKTWH